MAMRVASDSTLAVLKTVAEEAVVMVEVRAMRKVKAQEEKKTCICPGRGCSEKDKKPSPAGHRFTAGEAHPVRL